MKLQVIQHELEEHQPPATHGLFLGLWLGDVMFAVEYWCVRAVQSGVATLGFARRHAVKLGLAGLIAGSGALGAYNVRAQLVDAQLGTAQLDQRAIANGVELYRRDAGELPARLEDLVPKYLRELHNDPWGSPYVLFKGAGGVALVSAGPDRELGTGDDIVRVVKPQGLAVEHARSLLQPGDVITKVGDTPVDDLESYRSALTSAQLPVELDVQRGGYHYTVRLLTKEAVDQAGSK